MTHNILAVNAYAFAQHYHDTGSEVYATALLDTLWAAIEWRSPPSVVDDIARLIHVALLGEPSSEWETTGKLFTEAYEDYYYG